MGQLVGTVSAHQAKFAIKAGETKPPPEAKEAGREVAHEVKKENFDLGSVLGKIIPFRADRIEVRDSEVVLVEASNPKGPELWVSDLQLAIENLVTRKRLD